MCKLIGESTFNVVKDDNCKALSRIYRDSAPGKLMTLRKSSLKKSCSKENNKGCRKKLETFKTEQGTSNLPRTNELKTHKCRCQMFVESKNEECYNNCSSVYKNYAVKTKNCILKYDRNTKVYKETDEVQSDRNSREKCVNNKCNVEPSKPVVVKKQKRKLLSLDSSICINSPLDCTTDCTNGSSLYYEMTPYQEISVDKSVLVSGQNSENITFTDKEKQEVNSFFRKESCALFTENKARSHDFCQRLMATVVCTSMSHE